MQNIPINFFPGSLLSVATAMDLFCVAEYVAEYTCFFGFVQAKILAAAIAVFTVVILLILCARKSRLYFSVVKKIH